MANELTSLQYAVILDGNDGELGPTNYAATSSDPTVASIGQGPGFVLAVLGQSAGEATITATRNSDGAVAEMLVTVTEGTPGEFTIHLGDPGPKS